MIVIDLPKENDVIIVSNRQYLFLKENKVIKEGKNVVKSTYNKKVVLAMIDMIPRTYSFCD